MHGRIDHPRTAAHGGVYRHEGSRTTDSKPLATDEAQPPGVFDQNDLYSRKRWRQVQNKANVFWKRWMKEYLLTLQQRQKWLDENRNIAVDDEVLIMDDKWIG